jgi:hypothetical protein
VHDIILEFDQALYDNTSPAAPLKSWLVLLCVRHMLSLLCTICWPCFCLQRATGATKMNEVSSRSHAVCMVIVEKCTTNLLPGSGDSAAAAAAAMGVDGVGLLMAAGGPSTRKAVAAAAALQQQLQHSIKVCVAAVDAQADVPLVLNI